MGNRQSTLERAIDDFRIHQASMGYAENSVKLSQSILKQFRQHVGGLPLGAVTSTHVAGFMLEQGKRKSPRSMNSVHTQLTTFFKWAVLNERIKRNPMDGRRPPKFTERERVRIPASDFPRLLDLAEERDASARAFCAVGLFALLRDSEISNLEIRDVNLDECSLFSRIQKSRLEDTIPINAALHSELRRWLLHYESVVGHLEPDFRLIPFIKRSAPTRLEGGRYGPREFVGYDPYRAPRKGAVLVRSALEGVGVRVVDGDGRPLMEGAHTLRRSGARALYDALTAQGRADALRIVQTMLHHANIVQTQHYIGLNADRVSRDKLLRGAVLFDFERTDTDGRAVDAGTGLRLVR